MLGGPGGILVRRFRARVLFHVNRLARRLLQTSTCAHGFMILPKRDARGLLGVICVFLGVMVPSVSPVLQVSCSPVEKVVPDEFKSGL